MFYHCQKYSFMGAEVTCWLLPTSDDIHVKTITTVSKLVKNATNQSKFYMCVAFMVRNGKICLSFYLVQL